MSEVTPRFVERFKAFWANPDPDRVGELVADEAVAYWPGLPPIRGTEYPEHIRNLLALVDDFRIHVTAFAQNGDLTFISWESRGVFNGTPMEWKGIDRFRVQDGRAVEVFVSYDTAPFIAARARRR